MEYAMGVPAGSRRGPNHFIELLNIFHIKMPLWLAYDHWTGLHTATKIVARQMAQASDAALQPGTQAFLDKVDAIMKAQSPELVQSAHTLLNAPTIFGVEIGFNLPAFIIALVITAILVIGIKESARFNATIVTIKVAVVLFVIGLGIHYVDFSNWGHDWHSFAPMGFSGIGAGAAYIFFAYIGFDAVSTTAQEAKNPQRDLPIGIIVSLLICTILYIAVAGILTGMVHWQDVNIEAPIARAFMDRGLSTACTSSRWGRSLASRASCWSCSSAKPAYSIRWPTTACCRRNSSPRYIQVPVPPYKNTMLVGLLAAIVGSITPIDDIGKMVNIGTLLAFVIVCIAVMILRNTNPIKRARFVRRGCRLFQFWHTFQRYMMYKLGWVNWVRLFGWLAIGLVIYFTYSRYHSRISNAQESKAFSATGRVFGARPVSFLNPCFRCLPCTDSGKVLLSLTAR